MGSILRKWWTDNLMTLLPPFLGLAFGVVGSIVVVFVSPKMFPIRTAVDNSDFVGQSYLVEAKMDTCVDGLIKSHLLTGKPVQVFHLAQMRVDCEKRTALDRQMKVMGLSQ